jgi:hypothetical protein
MKEGDDVHNIQLCARNTEIYRLDAGYALEYHREAYLKFDDSKMVFYSENNKMSLGIFFDESTLHY